MHIVSYIRGITIHRYIDISYRKCKRYAYCIVGACIDTHDIYDPASTFQSMGENRGCWNPVRSAAFKQFKSVYYQDTILKSCQLKLLTLNLLTRWESKQLRANFINHLRVILQKNQNGGGQWRMLWQWVQSSLSKFKLSSEHGLLVGQWVWGSGSQLLVCLLFIAFTNVRSLFFCVQTHLVRSGYLRHDLLIIYNYMYFKFTIAN